MYCLIALALLELFLWLQGNELLPVGYGAGLLHVTLLLLVGITAYASLEEDKFYHNIVYPLCIAATLSHIARNLDLYAAAVSGDNMMSLAIGVTAFYALTIAMMVMPIVVMYPTVREAWSRGRAKVQAKWF